jgi:DNA-binding CsgD family transcriptional regulator
MNKKLNIAIISGEWLPAAGLKSVIAEIDLLANIRIFPDPQSFAQHSLQPFDFTFSFVSYPGIKSKIINPLHSEMEIRSGLCTLLSRTRQSAHQPLPPSSLSQRETEVLKLLVEGFINKEIADKLGISLHTVISHRKKITAKLGIKTVSGLTIYAIMAGLISY